MWNEIIKITVLLLLPLHCGASSGLSSEKLEDDPVVDTSYGKVRGQLQASRCKKPYYSFKGIPYAAPPVGELRFSAPIPPNTWDGVRDAKEDTPLCLQTNYLYHKDPPVEGDEDCLHINVFTPKVHHQVLLPVLVYIHYGGFFTGTAHGNYTGPEYFMDKDVVFVTFNYRLGVLGFLSTNDDASPGNWGLKDQVAALKWVQENIGAFGGDNKRVMIFGQSAGAVSVHYHLLSPASKGLFQRAISQSGSALVLWGRPHNKAQAAVADIQAGLVACPNSTASSTTAMIECLRKVDAVALVGSNKLFKQFAGEPFVVYGPVVEKKTDKNTNPYITEDPLDIIQAGKMNRVPWIIGVVSDEGILRSAPLLRQADIRDQLLQGIHVLLPAFMGLTLSVAEADVYDTWNKIAEHFNITDSVQLDKPETIQGFINLYGDRVITYGSYQSALLHALKGHNPVWFYHFAYRGQYSYGDRFAATPDNIDFKWGTSHCDDLLYLFSSKQLFSPLRTKEDLLMSKIMIKLWTNFAIYGHPTPRNEVHAPRWNPLHDLSSASVAKNSDLFYLNITGPYKKDEASSPIRFEINNQFYSDRMHFWNSLNLFETVSNVE